MKPMEPEKLSSVHVKMYNKLEDNFHLSNKKALFLNMKNYYEATSKDVFSALPVTFHIKEGLDDIEFLRFKNYYDRAEEEMKAAKRSPIKKKELDDPDQPAIKLTNKQKKNIWIVKPGENTNRGNGIIVAKDFSEIKQIIIESTASRKRTCIVQKYINNPLLYNRRKFDIRVFAFFSSVNGHLKGYFY